jgi:hypothetical protein
MNRLMLTLVAGAFGALLLMLAGCATVSVTPQPIRQPEPAAAMNAIEAEPTYPSLIEVRDFDFVVTDCCREQESSASRD